LLEGPTPGSLEFAILLAVAFMEGLENVQVLKGDVVSGQVFPFQRVQDGFDFNIFFGFFDLLNE